MHWRSFLLPVISVSLLPFAFASCSSGSDEGFGKADTTVPTLASSPPPTGSSMSTTSVLGDPSDAGPGDGASAECPESATLVYVTGVGSKLYSFFPPTKKFTEVGKFDCLSDPSHMTVDRLGNAWVVAGGLLYKASTNDAKCKLVSNWKFQFDYPDFALSFVGLQDTDTTLYVLSEQSKLSAFDTASGALRKVGTVGVTASRGDMTSNGDGSLYFLHGIEKPVLYQFDPANGSTRASRPIAAMGGGSQALAFWGGRFYAFESSNIFEYDFATKSIKELGQAPLQVTGAGQSTCVPKVPPLPK
jgi:hypothetical protein